MSRKINKIRKMNKTRKIRVSKMKIFIKTNQKYKILHPRLHLHNQQKPQQAQEKKVKSKNKMRNNHYQMVLSLLIQYPMKILHGNYLRICISMQSSMHFTVLRKKRRSWYKKEGRPWVIKI